jgi:hypothetical protein
MGKSNLNQGTCQWSILCINGKEKVPAEGRDLKKHFLNAKRLSL